MLVKSKKGVRQIAVNFGDLAQKLEG